MSKDHNVIIGKYDWHERRMKKREGEHGAQVDKHDIGHQCGRGYT
jgi:hypothetical protein